MAFLDIVILDDKKNEIFSVSLDSRTHQDLIRMANPPAKFSHIHRLQDFYKDAKFESTEIDNLMRELAQFRSALESASSLSREAKNNVIKFLKDFEKLCELAQSLGLEIHCFSD
ncbi:MAG: hypothetical protein ACREOO_24000 [bacterium]